MNFYAYVGNNPVNNNDPSGNCAGPVLGGLCNVGLGYGLAQLTGQDYSWQQGLTDFGVGAATSGLGVLANIGKVKTAFNTGIASGKISGNAQSTGTLFHALRSEAEAVKLANTAGVQSVYVNQRITTIAGVSGKSGYTVPDVTAKLNNGSLFIKEVGSKTDDFYNLIARNENALNLFGIAGKVDDPVMAGSLTLPFSIGGTRTLGAVSPLAQTDWLLQSGTNLGANTFYQGIFGGSAGGGFLLYPNKSNTNMMQSVYSK